MVVILGWLAWRKFPNSVRYCSWRPRHGECLGRSGFHKRYSELDAVTGSFILTTLTTSHSSVSQSVAFTQFFRCRVEISVDSFLPTSAGGPYLSCFENKDIAGIVCLVNNRELCGVVGAFVFFIYGVPNSMPGLSSRPMFFRYFGEAIQTKDMLLR